MTDEGTENLKEEKVSLDWMKDKEKMENLTKEQSEELAKLYVTDWQEKGKKFPTLYCANCGKAMEDLFKVRGKKDKKTGKDLFFCSRYCFDGRKPRVKKK